MKKLVILPVLALLLVAGCTGGPITLSTPGSQPSIISFNVEPSSISAGESANLSWNVSGATTITIDQGIGSVALTGTRAVVPAATTTYTLTASSSGGIATATTQVIVTGTSVTPPPPTPTPEPASLPVVDYFVANPPAILVGGSTTLGWNVLDATSVTIDNGIGSVGSAGTAVVSPPVSTNYTLTATNAVGWASVTVTVAVGAAPAAGMPDLTIQDIVRGGTITYTIKNQGDAVAGPSTSTLRVDGAVVANSNVGSLVPGESQTLSFGSYAYTCSGISDTIVVQADTGNTVVESSEVNNSRTESWSCILKKLYPSF